MEGKPYFPMEYLRLFFTVQTLDRGKGLISRNTQSFYIIDIRNRIDFFYLSFTLDFFLFIPKILTSLTF